MFDRIPFLVETEQCLNRRYRQAGCTRCVAACPVAAIALPDGAPALDAAACVNCGACLPTCPTGVFSQRVDPEELLVQAASQAAPAERLAVACPVHPRPASTQAPVDRVLRHSRCLASLGVEHWLALSRDGQVDVWLDDTPCSACAIGRAHGTIEAAGRAANALLAAFELPARVRLVSQAGVAQHRRRGRLPVTQATPGSPARRELFTRLKRIGQEAVGQASAPQAAELPLPPARQRLLRQVQRWTPPAAAMLPLAVTPLAAVHVDEDTCSACGLCAKLCPTAALRLETAVAREVAPGQERGATLRGWRLNFRPAACVACGICALACPERAISYGDQLPIDALSGGELTLADGLLTSCASCGTAVAARGEPTPALCYACRQGAVRVDPMADTGGLMADLRRRLPPPGAPSA